MSRETTITIDQLHTLYLNTELGGQRSHLNHFSYAEKGTSAYSFGLLQFDVGNDDGTREFLRSNGFSADDIEQLSRHGGLSREQLDMFDAKLQAIPQEKVGQFTNQRLERNIERVDDAITSIRARNPAAADAIARNPELQLAMADYDNQFGSMGKQFINYLLGDEIKLRGGTVKAGNPPTREDVQSFIDNTKFGVENPEAAQGREDRFDRAMEQIGIQQGGQTPQTQVREPAAQGQGTWPAPGNYSINKADKPGEGAGEWNTRRPAHRDGDGHDGVDIQGNVGDPIKAFKSGTVVTASSVRGYGNTIDIRHDDGSVTRYAHLDSIDAKVKPGHPVGEGQQIGKMGQTGNSPKAGDAHLHFEVRINGKDVDPMPFLAKTDREGRTQAGPATASAQPEKTGAMKDGVLKVGDRGPEVKEYLEKLDKLGYRGPQGESLLADKPDIYGPAARFATEKFQQAHGLTADGKAGKDTLPAVEKALGNPLLSEANHPANGYYRNVAAQIEKFSPGSDPRIAMNVAKEGIQEGYKEPQVGYSKERGLFAIGPAPGAGVTPGTRTLVEAGVPADSAQALSDRAAVDFKAMDAAKPTPAVLDAGLEERHRMGKPMSVS